MLVDKMRGFVANDSVDEWYPPGIGKGTNYLTEPMGHVGNCSRENGCAMTNRINMSAARDFEFISKSSGFRRLKEESEELFGLRRKTGEKL